VNGSNGRMTAGRRASSKLVRRAMKEKDRRDRASAGLEDIKREVVALARASGVSRMSTIDRATGQRITVFQTRSGPPLDRVQTREIVNGLPADTADLLFPVEVRRSVDWPAVQDFLAREHRPGSVEERMARRIAGAVDNDASWGMRVSDPRPSRCIECDAEVPEDEPLQLCRDHRKWYKISQIMMKLGAGDPAVDLRRFNDKRCTRYRARFLTKMGVEAWETRTAKRKQS
jgi:hypothetical protein